MTLQPLFYKFEDHDPQSETSMKAVIRGLNVSGVNALYSTNGSFAGMQPEIPRTLAAQFEGMLALTRFPWMMPAIIVFVNSVVGNHIHYGQDPGKQPTEEAKIGHFGPALTGHFNQKGIPVFIIVHDTSSPVPIQQYLRDEFVFAGHNRRYVADCKMGPWGNADGKFIVTHGGVENIFTFPYRNAQKPDNLNNGPWNGQGADPRDVFRHQTGVKFAHVADHSAQWVSLYEDGLKILDAQDYLNAKKFPNSPLANPNPVNG